MTRTTPIAVLFICLGNICRSPSAEAVFRGLVQAQGLEHAFVIDSAGTSGWHEGEPPDPRTIRHGEARGYALKHLRGRQLCLQDWERFDHLLVMDDSNLHDALAVAPPQHGYKVRSLLSLSPQLGRRDVPDPYYGGEDGFEQVLDLLEVACADWLTELRAVYALAPNP